MTSYLRTPIDSAASIYRGNQRRFGITLVIYWLSLQKLILCDSFTIWRFYLSANGNTGNWKSSDTVAELFNFSQRYFVRNREPNYLGIRESHQTAISHFSRCKKLRRRIYRNNSIFPILVIRIRLTAYFQPPPPNFVDNVVDRQPHGSEHRKFSPL